MKLLLDEMYSPVLAEQLRRRGNDVVAVKERDDLVKKQDSYLLAVARLEGRAIVTENIKDFHVLHLSALEAGATHPGLINTTVRSFIAAEARKAASFAPSKRC